MLVVNMATNIHAWLRNGTDEKATKRFAYFAAGCVYRPLVSYLALQIFFIRRFHCLGINWWNPQVMSHSLIEKMTITTRNTKTRVKQLSRADAFLRLIIYIYRIWSLDSLGLDSSTDSHNVTIFCFAEILSLAWETKNDRLVRASASSLSSCQHIAF